MAKTYNSIPTVSTGDVYTATAHNNIVENSNNYRVPPMVKVGRNGSNQSITPGASAYVQWNNASAAYDTDGMWSSGSNTRLTVQTPGIYAATWGIFVGWTGVSFSCELNLTHTTSGGTETTIAQDFWYLNNDNAVFSYSSTITGYFPCVAGDYFRAKWANQVNGTSTVVGGAAVSFFSATWLGQAS